MGAESILRRPEVRVFAGPNGSGKSTFTTEDWIVPPYINADDLQRELGIPDIAAAQEAERRRESAIQQKRSFTFETVLSTQRNLLLLQRAKDLGYFVKGYYVFTRDPVINIARVKSRVLSGGHDVDPEKVVSRYWKSRAQIPTLFQICDILHIYDNSDENPVRIVRKHKSDLSVFPNRYWSAEDLKQLIGV